jgi:hypothetical protein
MDQNFDISSSFTTFELNSTIYPNWYLWKGFLPSDNSFTQNPPLLGLGILFSANSTGAYTGQQSCQPQPPTTSQRWGDYMTMLWDPNYSSPNQNQAFWTVQEYTTGGSNQSTQFAQLADPVPYIVGYNAWEESECPGADGKPCTLTITTPSGLQNGDVVVVTMDTGGYRSTLPTPPDSTWTALPIANMNNQQFLESGFCYNHDPTTAYVFSHVYGASSETGSYAFSQVKQALCGGAFQPELEGALYAYRGANTNFSKYLLYAYINNVADYPVLTDGPSGTTSPSPGTLLNIFWGNGSENPEATEPNTYFTAPKGATPEVPGNNASDYYLADVPIPSAGVAFGEYRTNVSTTGPDDTFGWQLFMPD